jgi:hypothetical protein
MIQPRILRNQFDVVTFEQAAKERKAYWKSRTPLERVEA